MNKYTIILIIIIAAGFLLRIVGFNFEYLFDSVSDENYPNSCVLRMINNKSLMPNNCGSLYPALYTLINAPAIIAGLFILLLKNNFNLEAVQQLIALYPFASTLPLVRLFSVVMGTATIFLIYKITKNLFGSQTKGLIAAAFLAVSLLPVQLSHWGKAWALVLFFSFLALHYAVLIYRDGLKKHYILNAIFTSSAFGIHYGGFFSVIFIFLAHFFRKARNNKNLYLNLGLSLLLSILWLFLNKDGVYNFLFDSGTNASFSEYYQEAGLGQYFSNTISYLKNFALFDPVVFLLFWVALFFNFRRLFKFEYLILISFFIFYLAGMVLLNFGVQARWSLVMVAIAIPIVADLVGDFTDKFKNKIVYLPLIIILLLPSLTFSAAWDYILTLPNTRFAAKEWVEKNIPADSKILSLDSTLILAVSQDGAKDLNNALSDVRQPNPRYLYLAENGQNVRPGYRVVSEGQFHDNPNYPEWKEFDYYLLSYLNETDYGQKIAFMPPFENLKLISQIRPFEAESLRRSSMGGLPDAPLEYLKMLKDIKMTGPVIEIYKSN